jgi:hypothetical protein
MQRQALRPTLKGSVRQLGTRLEVEMTESRRIAGLLGPTLVALAASEALNPHIGTNVPATRVYLAGSLWVVAGLSIVRAHNRWMRGWPVLITLMGWFALLGGLLRMCAPRLAQRSVPGTTTLLVMQMVLLTIGIYLTVKAYGRSDGYVAMHPGRLAAT